MIYDSLFTSLFIFISVFPTLKYQCSIDAVLTRLSLWKRCTIIGNLYSLLFFFLCYFSFLWYVYKPRTEKTLKTIQATNKL